MNFLGTFIPRGDNSNRDYLRAINILKGKMEKLDRYTYLHSYNVSKYSVKIGIEMGLSKEAIQILQIGGILHDIGKCQIPEWLLNKKEPLTPGEFELIKKHPVIGCGILGQEEFFFKCKDAILYHHERPDGQGYPVGLKKGNIPLAATIISVADAFDAMITERVYSKAISINDALKVLDMNKKKQFFEDPVDALLKIVKDETIACCLDKQ